MKNYLVQAIIKFDDYEGLEIKSENPKKERKINDVFNVTKERYEYLKKLNYVRLVGIDKQEDKPKKKK